MKQLLLGMDKNTGKSTKTRFGIVGTNFITDWILEASRLEPRFEATAIYSRTQTKADLFAAKHNILNSFTDLDAMAKSDLIDAVYIASPTSLHLEQSLLFMTHGKHVLCEKPLASNAREVRQMITVAKDNSVLLMEAMKSTVSPNFLNLKKHISALGTVRRYFSSYCQYSSRYDKLKEGIVLNAFDPQFSNGSSMDLGVYTIYPMISLFGKPLSVNATGLKLSTGVDGQAAVNFEYEEISATVIYSKVADSYLPTEIQGEEGVFTIDKIHSMNSLVFTKKNKGKIDFSFAPLLNEYYYELAEFINVLESGRLESSLNSHQNSLYTIEIIDEIRKQLGVSYPADLKN